MAPLDRFLSSATRRLLPPPTSSVIHSPFFPALRFLSSKPDPPPPIKPVSYPVKPLDSQPTEDDVTADVNPTPPPRRTQSEPPAASPKWTRAEARFVKDAPSISPVSYPAKVAPLPDDLPAEEKNVEETHEELKKEARRIEGETRVKSYFVLQEEDKLPFPAIIKQDKRPQRTPIDLQEAIREVKVTWKLHYYQFSCL